MFSIVLKGVGWWYEVVYSVKRVFLKRNIKVKIISSFVAQYSTFNAMKRIFAERIFLFSLLLWVSGCASLNRPDDYWFAKDKAMHFGASAVIAGGTTSVMINNNNSEDKSAGGGFGIAIVFGIGKETYDACIKKTYWSWKDFVWDILGAGAGALAVSAMEK